MTSARAEHDLLCRIYGSAPLLTHHLDPAVSDFGFWQERTGDRRGEAVFGLVLPQGQLVLTRHASYPPDVWRVPSGGICHGEAATDAALREAREELGLATTIQQYAGCIEFEFRADEGGDAISFPSFCFLIGSSSSDETCAPCAAGSTDGEIQAWRPASGRAELSTVTARLRELEEPWADWGRYRSSSAELVAAAWGSALSEAGVGEGRGPTASSGEGPGMSSSGASWPRDLTLPLLAGTAVYPGDPPVEVRQVLERAPGALGGWQVSALGCTVHAGTHVDAPSHWYAGAQGIDDIPASRLCGPATVIDCRHVTGARRQIAARDLEAALGLRGAVGGGASLDGGTSVDRGVAGRRLAGRIVLIRQGLAMEHSVGRVPDEHLGLAADAAALLAGAGVAAVGVEALSVDPPGGNQAHRVLLGAGIPLIEGLVLEGVAAGAYWLHAAPLRLAGGAEAAPCRALLWPAEGPWARRR